MKIYKNGVSYIQSTGEYKLMNGIKKFKIGSYANGTNPYDGNVDEFSVFNTELDPATIQQWMHKKIDSTHPYYSNLILNYHFDERSQTVEVDSSSGHHNGT